MTVYFIGAGVGGVEYLTVKAYHLLQEAEVIIYDALIDQRILNLVSENAIKLDVGKRGGKISTSQTKINQLLVDYAQEYQTVIRLKSGDPTIFARINPELEALATIKADFQIIPSISSALAAPILAGIILTDKEESRCFTVLSGHNPEQLDWPTLSKIDTLVILMGGRNLAQIVSSLQAQGKPSDCPLAIIRWAGSPQQQIWWGTLGDIVTKTLNISLSPCVIVIGKVVDKAP
jgi:uroporphyrin-III C-methyltransferase